MSLSVVNELMQAVRERFWRHVDMGCEGECWEWKGARTQGYGSLKVMRRTFHAHRVSWELHNGPVPDGKVICHKCDNPACVNPAHLFLGTQKDNVQYSVKKGRHSSVNQTGRPRSGPTNLPSRVYQRGPSYYFVSPVTNKWHKLGRDRRQAVIRAEVLRSEGV